MSDIKKSAVISPDGLYRYSLERTWDEEKPTVLFVCLNPSTADAVEDDATVRRMINLAHQFGAGRLLVGNLFAFRSKNRNDLIKAADPVGPENDKYLDKLIKLADIVVAAWGNFGSYLDRSAQFREKFRGHNIKCLAMNEAGEPRHLLYVPDGTQLSDMW